MRYDGINDDDYVRVKFTHGMDSEVLYGRIVDVKFNRDWNAQYPVWRVQLYEERSWQYWSFAERRVITARRHELEVITREEFWLRTVIEPVMAS